MNQRVGKERICEEQRSKMLEREAYSWHKTWTIRDETKNRGDFTRRRNPPTSKVAVMEEVVVRTCFKAEMSPEGIQRWRRQSLNPVEAKFISWDLRRKTGRELGPGGWSKVAKERTLGRTLTA